MVRLLGVELGIVHQMSLGDQQAKRPGSIEPASLEIRLLANSRPGPVPARVLMRILILSSSRLASQTGDLLPSRLPAPPWARLGRQ